MTKDKDPLGSCLGLWEYFRNFLASPLEYSNKTYARITPILLIRSGYQSIVCLIWAAEHVPRSEDNYIGNKK